MKIENSKLKIVFFGTPDFAVPTLKLLIESGYNISAVFTGLGVGSRRGEGPSEAGTPQKGGNSVGPISILAHEHGIKVFQPVSLKKAKPRSDAQSASTTEDERIFEEFKNLNPDICIIAAYGKIIPQKFLDIPRYGFLNIHPSLLPKYRGPSPIQTAILNGDKETGVAIMVVDVEVDHGPILAEAKYEIDEKKYFPEIARELFELGAKLLIETLPKYKKGEIEVKPQEHSQATFTKIFTRDDGRINWAESAEKIYNQVRALNPEPGTWTTWPACRSLGEGGKGKVINIPTSQVGYPQVGGLASKIPGTTGKMGDDIVVGTGMGYLIIKTIQIEGGKVMDIRSFVNGHSDFVGSQLK